MLSQQALTMHLILYTRLHHVPENNRREATKFHHHNESVKLKIGILTPQQDALGVVPIIIDPVKRT